MVRNPSESDHAAPGAPVNTLLHNLNRKYMTVHFEKENAFWNEKMGLSAKIDG